MFRMRAGAKCPLSEKREQMILAHALTYSSIGLAVLAIVALPKASADEWDQKTIVSFSGPVEVPGQVLPAGTYVFKVVDSQSDRNIVEVYNKNESHLYGTFLAVPDYHLKPRGKTVISFEERAAGAPEAVKAWFYPGDNYGHEFVYPKVRASQLAQTSRQPVPSMPNELASNNKQSDKTQDNNSANVTALKQAPLKAQKPNQEEVDILEVFPVAPEAARNTQATPPANEQAYNDNQVASRQAMPDTLPKTGDNLPFFGLIGLVSLAAAGTIRYGASTKIR